jgi:flagellar hook-basal body complex protein FliE
VNASGPLIFEHFSDKMANNKTNITDQLNTAVKHVGESVENAAQSISDFFQGNPFDSEVGKKIEMATVCIKFNFFVNPFCRTRIICLPKTGA